MVYVKSKNKFVLALLAILAAAAFGVLFRTWWISNTAHATIDYGEPSAYSPEEIDDAAQVIFDDFHRNWRGFDLHGITYLPDEDGAGLSSSHDAKYEEFMVFAGSFRTPEHDYQSSGFPTNKEVDDWRWYLAREHQGDWVIVTHGPI